MRTIAACALLIPTQAMAAGYYFPDSGIVALGQGGAFVASGDTQFAQYYNPAGLIRIERPTLNVGMSGVSQSVRFQRMDLDKDGEDVVHDPVDNQGGMFAVPQLGFATPLRDDLAFAFGFTSPFAPSFDYEPDGPQRYTMIDSLIWNFQLGPSMAWQPLPQVTVGASFQWNVLRVDQHLMVTTSGQDNPSTDVAVEARVWDTFRPSFNAGVLIEPHELITVGLAVQPPTTYQARGEGALDFSEHSLYEHGFLDQARWEDDDVGLDIQLPLVLRSGLAVRPIDGLEVEASFIYEAWSALDDIRVTDIDITLTGMQEQQVDEELSLPAGFQDAWSVRLGGSYRLSELLEVRAGSFYERSALPEQQVSVALVDTNKVQVGSGFSVYVPGDLLVMDVSGGWLFYEQLQIRDSEVRQVNVLEGEEKVVGNGDITASGLAIGAQARVMF